MTIQTEAPVDHDRLNALLGQAVVEFGATVNAALVVIGDRLGLYRARPPTSSATPSRFSATIRCVCYVVTTTAWPAG
jgi:hypothetical protein